MIRISFLGDIILNGRYNIEDDSRINPFNEVAKILKNSDIVVGNLEALVHGRYGENLNKNPRLYTEYNTLRHLLALHLNLVSLANNHFYDGLEDGYKQTIEFLDAHHIKYLGVGKDSIQASRSLKFEKKGIRFCFLNYLHIDTNPCIPENPSLVPNWLNPEKVRKDIIAHRDDVDIVILLLHWGGRMDGAPFPAFYQRQDAISFLETGADIIVGHHSHTLQPFEKIGNKYVFYSLGNFCGESSYKGGWRASIRNKSAVVHIEISNIPNRKVQVQHITYNGQQILPVFSNTKYNAQNSIYKIFKQSKYFYFLTFFLFKVIEPVFYYFFGHDRTFRDKFKTLTKDKAIQFIKRIIQK